MMAVVKEHYYIKSHNNWNQLTPEFQHGRWYSDHSMENDHPYAKVWFTQCFWPQNLWTQSNV